MGSADEAAGDNALLLMQAAAMNTIRRGLFDSAFDIADMLSKASSGWGDLINKSDSNDDGENGAGNGAGGNGNSGSNGDCDPTNDPGGEEQDDWIDSYDWTDHAIEAVMDEDISPDDVYDAIENPIDVRPGSSNIGPTTVYEGERATAVLNSLGVIVTVWRY